MLAARRPGPHARALSVTGESVDRAILVLGLAPWPLATDPLPWDELAGCDAVYFTGRDPDTLRLARAAGRVVVTGRRREVLEASGVRVDLLVTSAADPAEAVDPAALPVAPAAVVWTEGGRGGRYRDAAGREGRWSPAPPPGPPVDSYGCGDSFVAGADRRGGPGPRPGRGPRARGPLRGGEPHRTRRPGRAAARAGAGSGRAVALPGGDRHVEPVLRRRQRTAPARVVGAGRVVGVVEVEHEPSVGGGAQVRALHRVEQVAPAPVGPVAGEGVAEGQEQPAPVALQPVDDQRDGGPRAGPGARRRCGGSAWAPRCSSGSPAPTRSRRARARPPPSAPGRVGSRAGRRRRAGPPGSAGSRSAARRARPGRAGRRRRPPGRAPPRGRPRRGRTRSASSPSAAAGARARGPA